MRVALIGARGHVGSRAARALARVPGVEVIRLGRPRIDLCRPETFKVLDDMDLIVNTSETHVAPPDALARYVLDRGLTLLEASSDRVVVERLLDTHRTSAGPGTLILGAGIFTGLSNLVAADAARALPGADTLALGVCWSLFSAAGAGTISLMTDAMATDACSIVDGKRVLGPPIARGPTLPFSSGPRPTLIASFPEPAMLSASTKVPNITMSLSPIPSLLRFAFLLTPVFLLRLRVVQWLSALNFTILRRLLLSWRTTPMDLVARAGKGKEEAIRRLSTTDGMEAAGVAIAAMVGCLAPKKPGTFTIDEVVGLAEVVAKMRELSPSLSVSSY